MMFYFSTLEKPFKISIEAINAIPENSKLDLQIGLFHGAQLLCPFKTISIKNNGEVHVEVEFEITLANIPRMAKICFGLFEKRKNTFQPYSWVNFSVFDYKAKLRKRDTLHMWKYFLNDVMPTHEMLSPLR